MIFHAIVDEPFTVHDYFDNNKVKSLKKGDIIEYERYDTRGSNPCELVYFIRILHDNMIIHVPDFIIEGYVTNVPEIPMHYYTPKEKHVHIERCEGTFNANKLMSNIPREDIIDVKPMDNNTYLVIYVKENDK